MQLSTDSSQFIQHEPLHFLAQKFTPSPRKVLLAGGRHSFSSLRIAGMPSFGLEYLIALKIISLGDSLKALLDWNNMEE